MPSKQTTCPPASKHEPTKHHTLKIVARSPTFLALSSEEKQLLPHDRTIPPLARAESAKAGSSKARSAKAESTKAGPAKAGSSKAKAAPTKAKAAPAKAAPTKAVSAKPVLAKSKHVVSIKAAINTHYKSEAVRKAYTNMKVIIKANTNERKVRPDGWPVESWILDHFRNTVLPQPFVQELLTDPEPTTAKEGALMLWGKSPDEDRRKDNFLNLPDTNSEVETARWLTHYACNIAKLFTNFVETSPRQHVFSAEGALLPLAGGLVECKPDIILIDEQYCPTVDSSIRMSWLVVQSFIEITTQEGRSYHNHMRSILSKASNIFHAQIHR
ncbi:hypothetical protein HYPSUDRAFT_208744 [Hypholoma sublateritium FD-334 SS-4]|uniref:Uncharacterized protein n=1 Tax=Hypholoma sublateritium (strain FD-334 SS-4) TaxID=945553 RepID=A0A0D2N5E3_HYPSF|nr:hypothetical protein HYPSUDRAFT_208744 [Hypholoma sublateritium FD-334 SS-4]